MDRTIPQGLPSAADADREWSESMHLLFARASSIPFYVVVPGDPWSKSRPRFTRRGGQRAYQPRDDRDAEQALGWAIKAAKPRAFTGNVMLVCRFYRPNWQRVDDDNLIKHVCDSANGILWADDSQVTFLLGEVLYDPAAPRTVILAGDHESNLLRGDDRNQPCARCGEPFTAALFRPSRRYCSRECQHADRVTALTERVCEQCERSFQPTTKAQQLCSRECRADRLRGMRRAQAQPRSRCLDCGKELSHTRGGRCRDCWRADPGFHGPGRQLTDTEAHECWWRNVGGTSQRALADRFGVSQAQVSRAIMRAREQRLKTTLERKTDG